MAETTLKTRIKLLYKSYADWQAVQATFIPLKGEVCFCEVPASTGAVVQEPCVLFKVGDGAKSFAQLPWGSALAADVYGWAKKENLEFSDLTEDFKEKIKELVGGEEKNTLYQIVADGTSGMRWKLQKSEDGGTTWVDATGVIDIQETVGYLEGLVTAEAAVRESADEALQADIDAEVTRAKAEEAKKPDKQIVGTNGTAELWNEASGGGAHFINKDGSESFVGVNDGGKDGLMAQIYADMLESGSWVGSRINVYHNGIFYVSKVNQKAGFAKNAPEMEIATKKDIADLGQALHFVGIAEKQEGETELQAVERTFPAASQKAGAVAICGAKEFICCGSPLAWREFGDVSAYATKAELQSEATTRASEDATLQANINTEATARQTADATLQTNIDAEKARAQAAEATKADLPGECPPWLNPTGETPYPWFMASLDVESAGLGPDAEGNIRANVGAYNFNGKQYYKWEKNLPFAATTTKAGLMTAADKTKLDSYADGKLNILPNVDDPTDPGKGYPYHIPYRFDVDMDATQASVTVHTLTLDNKLTKMTFSKVIPSATQTTAGLMSAADKVRVDKIDTLKTLAYTANVNDLVQTSGDVLILDCNL